MKKYLILITLSMAFSACGQKRQKGGDDKIAAVRFPPPIIKADNEVMEKQAPAAEDIVLPNPNVGASATPLQDSKANGNNTVSDTSKKIIKSGDIQFETNDVVLTRKRILQAIKKYNGYVEEDNQSTNGDDNHKEYVLKIRIPAKYFDLLLDSVSSTADKIDTKNIAVTDVSTQYIDIKTRLDNKKVLENRYLDLLKKATRIPDLLEIENKLTEIRSDIESTQGQLNYLGKQVTYSSLEITFYAKQIETADKGVGYGYKFKTAITDGWAFLQNLCFGLISLWPVIIIGVAIAWLIKRWRRKRRLRKNAE